MRRRATTASFSRAKTEQVEYTMRRAAGKRKAWETSEVCRSERERTCSEAESCMAPSLASNTSSEGLPLPLQEGSSST